MTAPLEVPEMQVPTPVVVPDVVELRLQLVDPAATHQIHLTWASSSKQEVVAMCNCGGFIGTRRRPEDLGSVQAAISEYEGHLVEVGYTRTATLW